MPTYELVKTVVFDERMYQGRGVVNRWIRGVTTTFEIRAKEHAPVNKRPNTGHGAPGALKASIKGEVTRVGPRQITGDVSVNVPYAMFVLRGTTGTIYSTKGYRFRFGLDRRLTGPFKIIERKTKGPMKRGKRGYFMKLPVNPEFHQKKVYHFQVSGQQPNNFLIKAYNQMATRHPALHPMVPGSITF